MDQIPGEPFPDHYAVLGLYYCLRPSQEDIKKAYHRRAREFHPDKIAQAQQSAQAAPQMTLDAATRMMGLLNAAYKELGTPAGRAAYDHTLSELSRHRRPARHAAGAAPATQHHHQPPPGQSYHQQQQQHFQAQQRQYQQQQQRQQQQQQQHYHQQQQHYQQQQQQQQFQRQQYMRQQNYRPPPHSPGRPGASSPGPFREVPSNPFAGAGGGGGGGSGGGGSPATAPYRGVNPFDDGPTAGGPAGRTAPTSPAGASTTPSTNPFEEASPGPGFFDSPSNPFSDAGTPAAPGSPAPGRPTTNPFDEDFVAPGDAPEGPEASDEEPDAASPRMATGPPFAGGPVESAGAVAESAGAVASGPTSPAANTGKEPEPDLSDLLGSVRLG
ncbi:hypothetical protein H696_01343 [Fonticula alba]|uniref:J domain-containing protein n=1 Tax=Fonticula alba TaxID=691883 RepID=A0A058ZC02_FONAL|nr:hypothetical protein H696_01343 [Fonticula alba]KCV71934.1 hypothetical protein H696_01343 [Fonticula alba]|eukprot:XP_009493512.1 hypothetical protein H696_01343 [Fonticula alba]